MVETVKKSPLRQQIDMHKKPYVLESFFCTFIGSLDCNDWMHSSVFWQKNLFLKSLQKQETHFLFKMETLLIAYYKTSFFLRSWQSSLNEWQRSQKYQNLKFQLFLKPFFRVFLHIYDLFWWVKKANFCFKKVKYKINICCKMRHFCVIFKHCAFGKDV